MASIISAGTSTGTALNLTGDTSGILQLASNNGTTAVTIDTAQNVGIGTASPSAYGAGYTTLSINATTAPIIDLKTNNTRNGSIYYDGTQVKVSAISNVPLTFDTNNAERVRIDANGIVGIGVIPSAWSAGSGVVQNNGGAIWQFGGSNIYVGQNYYYNGSNRIYSTTAPASEYQQGAGIHRWYVIPSGTAGTAVTTFTQAMTLDNSGNLLLGTTSSYGGRFNLSSSSNTLYTQCTNSGQSVGVFWNSGNKFSIQIGRF